MSKIARPLLLASAMLTLLCAMWAGLLKLGWVLPTHTPALSGMHGPLMISGFLGTLIGLERAVGLALRPAYLPPALTAVGAAALLLGLPTLPAAVVITLGSLGLVLVFGYILRQQFALHTVTMAAGAVMWLGGNLLWLLDVNMLAVVPWWGGYLVLTIAGERLELSRILSLTRLARSGFVAAVALFSAGLLVVILDSALGWRMIGAGLLAIAGWLLTHDIAWRTIRQSDLTRFIGIALLSGYVWLGVAGALALWHGFLMGGLYDAVLHALFLGFVFAMIFGHAPIIFPAVLGVPIPFRPAFYAHLIFLHLSLALRVGSGLTEWLPGRQWSGVLNMAAILLFMLNTVLAVIAGLRASRAMPGRPIVQKHS